jgi:hypothetical protein
LQAVIATAAMDEAQLSAWCREQGVYPTELQQWKSDATAALTESTEERVSPQQAREYRPQFPSKGFADLDTARCWVHEFVSWYNHEHRHSAIRYVSPAERHAGQDRGILSRRHQLYTRAREANPRRWARHTRNWQPIAVVTLNPERDSVVAAAVTEKE